MRSLVARPTLALEHAKVNYGVARQSDPKINARLINRVLIDIASLGTVTLKNWLSWR